MAAETNIIKKNDLSQVREIEFVEIFGENIRKLMEALGVARKIPKQAGTVLKTYKASGVLEDGNIPEGEIIPLSHYKTEAVTYKEITLKKWRKGTTAEAIVDRGYDQAVEKTTDRMMLDVQKSIRKSFFDFLGTGTASATGGTLQSALAHCWGQLQVLFEDDTIQSVYFVNPLDVADYLAAANLTTQTAFGMTYVENFLNLGRVFFNTSVPKGKIYATAQDNLVLYYIPVNGADLEEAFTFTSDATGYIGIHEVPDYSNMTSLSTVVSGIELFAERLDGVVVGTISGAAARSTDTAGTPEAQSADSGAAKTAAKTTSTKS